MILITDIHQLIFALAFTKNVGGVWAIRLLLGMFESSFSPCLVAITVQWYLKHEQAYITTIWQAMFAVAGCFSSLMGYAFLKVDNTNQTVHGWQWLHVLVGILSLSSTSKSWPAPPSPPPPFLPPLPFLARLFNDSSSMISAHYAHLLRSEYSRPSHRPRLPS